MREFATNLGKGWLMLSALWVIACLIGALMHLSGYRVHVETADVLRFTLIVAIPPLASLWIKFAFVAAWPFLRAHKRGVFYLFAASAALVLSVTYVANLGGQIKRVQVPEQAKNSTSEPPDDFDWANAKVVGGPPVKAKDGTPLFDAPPFKDQASPPDSSLQPRRIVSVDPSFFEPAKDTEKGPHPPSGTKSWDQLRVVTINDVEAQPNQPAGGCTVRQQCAPHYDCMRCDETGCVTAGHSTPGQCLAFKKLP